MALFYFIFQCGISEEADGDNSDAESDLDFAVITVGLQLLVRESSNDLLSVLASYCWFITGL